MPKPKDEAEKTEEKKIDWEEVDFRDEVEAQRDSDAIIQAKIDAVYDPLQDPNSKYFERR